MIRNSFKSTLEGRELLCRFLDNAELKHQRSLFKKRLGNPVWWVASPAFSGRKLTMKIDPKSSHVWTDSRLDQMRCHKAFLKQILKKHRNDAMPFKLRCARHQLACHCIPLIVSDQKIGVLGLSHIKSKTEGSGSFELLGSVIRLILLNSLKDNELKRLTESIRPRAVALSTVHTVHRVINSTLNLDELLTRLTHLTSQVLRAKTCSIFLIDPSNETQVLMERAKAGFDKKNATILRSFKPGEGLEGKIFQHATFVLRKNTISVPLIDEDVIGVMTLTKKKDPKGFSNFDREILMTLAEEAVIAIKNARLYEAERRVTLSAIQSLASILGTKLEHTSKMDIKYLIEITREMAEFLRLSDEERQAVHYATLLKDAGKIGLPDEILKKREKLTGHEYQLVRQHPVKGARIIQSFESLKPVVPMILHSHEKFDGSGYPEGLKGEAIPIGARILAVVNAFEALIAGRPYRDRTTFQEAMDELNRNTGTQFDPKVMEAFQLAMKKLNIAGKVPRS